MTRVDLSLVSTTGEVIGEHKPSEHVEPQEPHPKSLLLDPEAHQPHPLQEGGCWQVRYTFAILGLVGIALMYAMRVVLSIAIVAMVGSRSHHHHSNTTTTTTEELANVCPNPDTNATNKDNLLEGEFDWDETMQGVILGSFFWGYIVTNIPGGRAAEYLGGKMVFGLGIVLSAILTILTPISARSSTPLLIAVRVLGGVVQGVVFPAINSMLATWIPPAERSRYNTIVYSGFPLGTVVCLPVGGWLCSSGFLDGWPAPFYLFGGLGLVWGVAWFLLIHDRPERHPRISAKELAHIQSFQQDIKRAEVVALPWKDIFFSLPFWGLMAGALGFDFGFYTLLTELPTYLKNIQHFDMSENGLMSSLPFLAMWLWGYLWGSIMDRLTAAHKLSILSIRRLSMALAMYGPMLGLVVMCFVNCNTTLAMVVLCVAVGQTLSAWRMVFLITVAMYLVTNTLYIIFISNNVQHWNEPKTNKEGVEYNTSLETRVALVPDDTKDTLVLESDREEC
ncbi:inorganic phosphate cotransporter-like 8, partial [Homarus americanus]